MSEPTEGWLWLSFADKRLLGVAIVKVPPRSWENLAIVAYKRAMAGHPDPWGPVSDDDFGIIMAVHHCTELGINPGGQVVAWPLVMDVPMHLRNRLLSRAELEEADLISGTVGERGGWENFL